MIHRARTGQGQRIDLAMLEATGMVMAEGLLEFAMNGREPRRLGNRDRWMAPHNCYKAKGGNLDWVTIAVGSEREWRAFCAAIGNPALAADPRFRSAGARKRNEDALDQIVTAWTRPRDRWEITAILQAAGVAAMPTLNRAWVADHTSAEVLAVMRDLSIPCAKVMNSKDMAENPHYKARGLHIEWHDEQAGKVRGTGIVPTFSGTPGKVWRGSPMMGQDNQLVYRELLGLSAEEITNLQSEGIV